jgi:cephalosporin-C deacetylase-like acetyl esterase
MNLRQVFAPRRALWMLLLMGVVLGCGSIRGEAAAADGDSIEAALAQISADVFPPAERERLSGMVGDDLRTRLRAANAQSTADWRAIDDRASWEAYSQPRIERLRASLGEWPAAAKRRDKRLTVRKTGSVAGDGFVIEKLAYESRPGIWVTANLYRPAKEKSRGPGILICHSHHAPKTSGELQDMGMTWARAGGVVLVIDQLGYGERRLYPFATAADYPEPFALGRQSYYFRYDTGIQLHLLGESYIGWLAWDLMRGVDLLVGRPEVDPQRIVLLGSVAGGGDPAAVTAALDKRIAAVVPFNFGGPQPETRLPLPDDAEASFNYAGGGSWESTRNLRRSAADGFLPWVIVGSNAPRGLIYAHEFSWDQPHDPVWKRLETIFGWYDAGERLAFTHGRGSVRGRPPEATHCTHIGREHRQRIHAALAQWFDIHVGPDDEYSNRVDSAELVCLTPEVRRELEIPAWSDVLLQMADERQEAVKGVNNSTKPRSLAALRTRVQAAFREKLGPIDPPPAERVKVLVDRHEMAAHVEWRHIALEVEPGITIPLLLLVPERNQNETLPCPVVVGVSQAGKQRFLRERKAAIAELLQAGIAVCLPDVRGTGETRPDDDRDQWSTATGRSSSELMLGGTTIGSQLRDLRAVTRFLRMQPRLDKARIVLWGDSFADVNPADVNPAVPLRVEHRPAASEPLGGTLALLGALYDDEIQAVYVRGGLLNYRDTLRSPFVYIPHDAVVPGAIPAGDLEAVAACLAPRPLCLAQLVDGLNRRATEVQIRDTYASASQAYQSVSASPNLKVSPAAVGPATWLAKELR